MTISIFIASMMRLGPKFPLMGIGERALQGEVWQIAEALGLWRGYNLYTDDSFPAQSYTAMNC